MLESIIQLSEQKLRELTLPDQLRPTYYSERTKSIIAALGAHDTKTYDFKAALDSYNREERLGLDEVELAAFRLMLGGLVQTQRFRGDPFIEPHVGENSAVHSCNCIQLTHDMFRRADLVDDQEMTLLRRTISIGVLIHDLDEILGEFNSLFHRAANTHLSEAIDIGARVFHVTMHYAIYCAENNKENEFYKKIAELKRDADVTSTLGDERKLSNVLEVLQVFEEDTLSRCYLTQKSKLRLYKLRQLQYVVENGHDSELSNFDRMVSFGVKVIEHTQGTRYLLRKCTRDVTLPRMKYYSTPTSESVPTVANTHQNPRRASAPISLTPSKKLAENFKYCEYGLGELFEAAKVHEKYLRLAKHLRNAVYETNVELIHATAGVFRRDPKPIPRELPDTIDTLRKAELDIDKHEEKLDELKFKLKQERSAEIYHYRELRRKISPEHSNGTLLELESSLRLMALYHKAIISDYIPKPGEVLALNIELPEQLHFDNPLPRFNRYLSKE